MKSSTESAYEIYDLVVKRLVAEQKVDGWLATTSRQVIVDASHNLVLLMSKTFLSQDTVEEAFEIKTPASWFQHLKLSHAPAWLLRKWPIEWKVISVPKTIRRCCPHVNIPNTETHVRFILNKPVSNLFDY